MEAMVPLGIIGVAIMAMGELQKLADHYTFGKPKAILQDHWDRKLNLRDREALRHPEHYGSAWQGMPNIQPDK